MEIGGSLPKPAAVVVALVVALVVVIAVDRAVAWLVQSAELTGGFFEAADCNSERSLAALPD